MSIAGAIRAGAAYVEILADNNPLTRGLATAKNQLQTWGKSLKGLGGSAFGGAFEALGEMTGGAIEPLLKLASSPAGAFAGFLGMAKMAADAREALADFSKETGVAVENIGSLKYAAAQTGMDLDGLSGAIFRIQGKIAQAADGEKAASAAFQRLGMNAGALKNMLPDEQLRAIATRLASITDKTSRAAAARELLGRGGGKMLPFLMELTELEERYKRLGMAQTTKADAEAGEEFNRTLGDLTALAKNAAGTIGGALLPELQGWATVVVENAKGVRDWVREHKGFFESAFKVSAIVTGIGGAFMLAGTALGVFGGWLGLVASGFSTLIGIGTGILSFLVSPFVLTTAAIVGTVAAVTFLVAKFWSLSSIGQEVLGAIGSGWDTVVGDMTAGWDGFMAAVGSGNLTAAWGVITATLKLEWQRVVNWFSETWTALGFVIKSSITGAWGSIQTGFVSMIWFLRSSWASFVNWFAGKILDGWYTAQKYVVAAQHLAGQITDAEARKKMKAINEERTVSKGNLKQMGDADQAALAKSLAGKKKAIADEQKAINDALGIELSDAQKARQDELDDAIAKQQEAIDAAKQKKDEAEKESEPAAGAAGMPGVDWGQKEKSAGSFGGVGAEQMAGTAPIKELVLTAKEANDIAKRNEKLLKALDEKVFAWQ